MGGWGGWGALIRKRHEAWEEREKRQVQEVWGEVLLRLSTLRGRDQVYLLYLGPGKQLTYSKLGTNAWLTY